MLKVDEKRFVEEMEALDQSGTVINLALHPSEAWILMSYIQLACRHPKNMGLSRKFAERIGRALQAQICKNAFMLRIAEAGWQPEFDVAAPVGGRVTVKQ